MVNELKIEVGKYYKTRGGGKAYIGYKVPKELNEHDKTCFIGLIVKDDFKKHWTWDEDGFCHEFRHEKMEDIISEWQEEPKVGWVYESCSREKWMVCEDKRKYGYSGEYPFVAFNLDENLAPWTGTVSVKGEISSLSILRNYLKIETGRPADED